MTSPNPTATALIIEDDPQIRRFVRLALESAEWIVYEAGTVKEGLLLAGTRQPDLIVLDLGLPDEDGVAAIRSIRSWSIVPIIVLSARTQETEKVSALDAGADDYLTKPFGVPEFLARVRAHWRAQQRRQSEPATSSTQVQFGSVEVDLAARWVKKAGVEVHLTPIEYRLLTVLIANAGKVLTQRQLLKEVWGDGYLERPHYLRVHMGHLRQKLEDNPAQPDFLLTETGVGYRLLIS
jgi:two-component system KDP operon response regulator KdpE